MGTLILGILVWFILGFVAQLLYFPRRYKRLSSGKSNWSRPSGTRNENLGGFWVIWAIFGVIGVCLYLDKIGFTF